MATALQTWLKNRPKRKVKVQTKEGRLIEIDGPSEAEVQQVLTLLEQAAASKRRLKTK